MGPTRKRDLTAATVAAALIGYLLVVLLYRWFPPITLWTGLSLLAVAIAEAGWAFYVRTKIGAAEIGDGPGRLHPLAVARSLVIAKASAWVGALVLGWWIGVLVYLLPRRSTLRVAGEDTAGAVVAAASALALVVGRAVASALLQVTAGAAGQCRRGAGVAERATDLRESPRRSTRAVTCDGYSQPMTVLTRGGRSRRSSRRPGWLLLTVLLVLAIAASSALVFTDRVELLKLAVILALWAAVVAAFVSVIYRRQSDMDQAKARDLKLVYDLQLDREISARREYELTVESHLRRELASELRAQAADEVAGAAGRAGGAAGQPGDPLRHRPRTPPGDRNRTDHGTGIQRLGARLRNHRPGRQQQDRHRRRTRTSTPAPRKARSSTCRPNPTRPSPNGRAADDGGAHRRPSEAEPQDRRQIAEEPPGARRRRRPRRRNHSRPSRLRRRPNHLHRRRRSPTGSPHRRKASGSRREPPAAIGCHPPRRTDRPNTPTADGPTPEPAMSVPPPQPPRG